MISRMAISTKGLVKRYGRTTALDGFTLDVPAGAVLGLVGPNGAGKTTWMMSVAGLLRIDAGEISVLGGGPFDASVHSGRLALLPQDSELPLEMTPESLFVAFARLQGLSAAAAREAAEATLAAVNLTAQARKSVRSLSHGMRKRVMVGQCFLGNPEVVLLDEPMNGLDPEEAERLRNLILASRQPTTQSNNRSAFPIEQSNNPNNRTILISSHNLLDLERLCTHVAFVEAGRVTRVGTIAELTADGRTLEECYLSRFVGALADER